MPIYGINFEKIISAIAKMYILAKSVDFARPTTALKYNNNEMGRTTTKKLISKITFDPTIIDTIARCILNFMHLYFIRA